MTPEGDPDVEELVVQATSEAGGDEPATPLLAPAIANATKVASVEDPLLSVIVTVMGALESALVSE